MNQAAQHLALDTITNGFATSNNMPQVFHQVINVFKKKYPEAQWAIKVGADPPPNGLYTLFLVNNKDKILLYGV